MRRRARLASCADRAGDGDDVDLLTNEKLLAILRADIVSRGGASAYARGIGVSSAFVSRILGGKKPVCGRVLQDLGFERVRAFRKKPAVIGHARGEVSSCDAGRSG